MIRSLDFSALAARPGVGDRWRAMRTDNSVVLGLLLGTLLVLVPGGVLVGLGVAGRATDDGGALALILMLVACGVYVLAYLWHAARDRARLGALAGATDLVEVEPGLHPHYTAGVFASEGHTVIGGVRTRDEPLVEVGERYPFGRRRDAGWGRLVDVYLRARLSGVVRPGTTPQTLLTPELAADLREWAGEHTIEVVGDELTVLGTGRLRPEREGRVRDGLALAERLAARADEVLVEPSAFRAQEQVVTPSGIPLPRWERPQEPSGRRPGPWRFVLAVLAFLVLVPILLALVMSVVESLLPRSEGAARVVVVLVIGACVALLFSVFTGVMRWATRRRS